MIRLGITGGIGSGKSTISELFKMQGIPIYIADIESKKLTETSPIIRKKLIEAFGDKLYKDGYLNKALFAQLIFGDRDKLKIANSIIHPEVDRDYLTWINNNRDHKIVAVEAAILFESDMVRLTDKVLMVYSPFEERVKRTMKRDNIGREKVIERINSQMSDEEKILLCDFVVHNDETKSLILQTQDIIKELRTNG